MLNEADEVSQAQQKLIMRYSDTKAFLVHYLIRHINSDRPNIIDGRKSIQTLMRATKRMSDLTNIESQLRLENLMRDLATPSVDWNEN